MQYVSLQQQVAEQGAEEMVEEVAEEEATHMHKRMRMQKEVRKVLFIDFNWTLHCDRGNLISTNREELSFEHIEFKYFFRFSAGNASAKSVAIASGGW